MSSPIRAVETEMQPLYEMTIDGEDPVVVTAAALMEAWGKSAPEGAARALDLQVGSQAAIMQTPLVFVRRIR